MRVYLDTCVLSRLTDDGKQLRVRIESKAVLAIFEMIFDRRLLWVVSDALRAEIMNNPDAGERTDFLRLLKYGTASDADHKGVISRAEELRRRGFGPFDAVHLAVAEKSDVEVLFTTDDRFTKQAARRPGNPETKVLNPVDWLKEMNYVAD